MTSQVRGLNQAARNANDGISLAQTAESGLGEIGANLQRMRELAVQSANSTNMASDRAALQAEVAQLLQEIQRVATTTQFNGQNILDGTFTAAQFQVGANANQTIVATTGNAQTDKIGSYQARTETVKNVTGEVLLGGQLVINGMDIGRSRSGSAESIAAAINAAAIKTGVTASARTEQTSSVDPMNRPLANQSLQAGDLVINGVNIGSIAGDKIPALQGKNVADAINARTSESGVSAVADASTGALTLTSLTGKDIRITTNNGNAGAMRVENATGLEMVGTAARAIDFNGMFGTSQAITLTVDATLTHVAGSTLTVAGEQFTFVANGSPRLASNQIEIGADADGTAANIRAALMANDKVSAVANVVKPTGAAATVIIVSKRDVATDGSNIQDPVGLNVQTAKGSGSSATSIGGSANNSGLVLTVQGVVSSTGQGKGYVAGSTLSLGGVTYEFVHNESTARHTVAEGNVAVVLGADQNASIQALETAIGAQYAAGRSSARVSKTFVTGDTTLSVTESKSKGSDRIQIADGQLQTATVTATGYSNTTYAQAALAGKKLSIGGHEFTFVSSYSDGASSSNGREILITHVQNDLAGHIKAAADEAINRGYLQNVAVSGAGGSSNIVTFTAKSAVSSSKVSDGILRASLGLGVAGSNGTGDLVLAAAHDGVGFALGDTLRIGGVTYEFGLANQQSASTAGNVLVKMGTHASDASTASKATAANLADAITEQFRLGKSTVEVRGVVGGLITVDHTNYGSKEVLGPPEEPISNGNAGYLRTYATEGSDGKYSENVAYGKLTLNASKNFTIDGTGAYTAGLEKAAVELSAIDKIDISSVEGANTAISLIDGALAQVASTRADLGALQNRFSSVVSSLQATSENLSAARSRIQDADFAQETAALTRSQILQQAGIAMLSQANALPQNVLSLLK